jgi:tRNA (mo5U34)-methyltransferase
VLDVGTHDGFWAFEMERLGARSVTALDVGDPDAFDFAGVPPPVGYRMGLIERRRQAFALAHSARDSRVEPYEMSVYDLAPDWFAEQFDLAVVGTLLHHLRDPIRALAAIRTVASTLLVNDAVSISLTLREPRVPTARFFAPAGRPFWWLPSIPALRHFLRAAGWSIERTGGPYLVPFGAGHRRGPFVERMRLGSGLLDELLQLRGTPHAWVLATAPGVGA